MRGNEVFIYGTILEDCKDFLHRYNNFNYEFVNMFSYNQIKLLKHLQDIFMQVAMSLTMLL